MKRPPMWLTLVVSLATLLVLPRTATGAEFVWSGSLDAYVDVNCNTGAQQFKVDAFRDASYGGPMVRICTPVNNLCNAPLTGTAGCSLLFGNQSLNDRLSSYRIWSLPAGRCLVWFRHSGYSNALTAATSSAASMSETANDAASSVRLGC